MWKASGSGFVELRESSGEKSTNSNDDGGAGCIAAECGSTRSCENSIGAYDPLITRTWPRGILPIPFTRSARLSKDSH
jgi:hypothetical protein